MRVTLPLYFSAFLKNMLMTQIGPLAAETRMTPGHNSIRRHHVTFTNIHIPEKSRCMYTKSGKIEDQNKRLTRTSRLKLSGLTDSLLYKKFSQEERYSGNP